MRQPSPNDRDRAQKRVRSLTMGSAVAAGALTLVGAAVTAGTFAGRTVGVNQSIQTSPTVDPNTGLLPPLQAPGTGSGPGGGGTVSAGPPIVSGGS